jgi:predicted phosphodiesterase
VSRRKQKKSFSQVVLWVLSVLMVLSMALSLIIVALPGPAEPAPTAAPTWTPRPLPTASPLPSPSPIPLASPTPTEPIVGPSAPTVTATVTSSLELAPPAQPEAPTATPAAAATVLRIVASSPARTAAPPAASASSTASAASLTFAVAGDSRHNPEIYGRVLAAVTESGSEFLVHTGDMVDEGSEEQWQIFEQSMAGFSLPFYPVPGNHDALGGKLDGYLVHSRAPAAHYSLDSGPVHLVMADTHHGGVSAAELAWLRDDLSRTAQPLKMVFMHHPPFDPDGTDHIMAYGNEAVMDLMAEMDVDYVFAGHIHAYVQGERDGVAYYITGGAGAPLYGGHAQAVHHYLLVTVRGQQATVEMIQV